MLAVRLPAELLRRLKSTAARRGVTLQDAVREAAEAWTASGGQRLLSLDELRGSLAGTDALGLLRRERDAELKRDDRLVAGKSRGSWKS